MLRRSFDQCEHLVDLIRLGDEVKGTLGDCPAAQFRVNRGR
jgi:hypothetical protein